MVGELRRPASRKDAEKICSDMLAPALVERLKSGRRTASTEMDEAIADADDFDLEVTDVTVSGAEATAKVRQGSDGPTTTFEFAEQDGDWRVTSLGAA